MVNFEPYLAPQLSSLWLMLWKKKLRNGKEREADMMAEDKTTVNVPLDEVLSAINLIVDDRGEGIWEILPTLFGLWNSHRDRAKHLSKSLQGDEPPSASDGTEET